MKLCIIGNSHCAALHDAWKELGNDHPELEVTIFAAPHRGPVDTAVNEGRLEPLNPKVRKFFKVSSGGLEEIELRAYDRFLVYGLIRNPPPEQNDKHYSSRVLQQSRRARFRHSQAHELISALREATSAPIDVAAMPYRLGVDDASIVRDDDAIKADDIVSTRLWGEQLKAGYIPQPKATRQAGRATRPEFGKGARRLSAEEGELHLQDDGQDSHMNTEYGRIWWHQFLPRLGTADAVSNT